MARAGRYVKQHKISFHQVADDVIRRENAFFCEAKVLIFNAKEVVPEVALCLFQTIVAILRREFVEGDASAGAKASHDEFVVEAFVAECFCQCCTEYSGLLIK